MDLAALILGFALALSSAAGPAGDAFYSPPRPLAPGAHGDVIWSRPLVGAAALPSAASNTLVLYHTVSATGQDVAVSGAVAIPKGSPPAGGWPVISWAHGTTGNAPSCAPTRGGEANVEQRALDAWVARGYAVAQTDYEGQGTPGLHPYLVGVAAAHDVTDIVRAARLLDPAVGLEWFALGHSEGGAAALFSASVGPAWAPELHLRGAVAYAPVTHIADELKSISDIGRPTLTLPFVLEMIEGIGSSDPAIHLDELLSSQALARLPELQRRCVDELMDDRDFLSLRPSDIFLKGIDTGPLLADFVKNEANRVHSSVPILMMQGEADELVTPYAGSFVNRELCANGTPVTYELLPKLDHDSIVTDTLPRVAARVDARRDPPPPSAMSLASAAPSSPPRCN